jgi:hypothetical protein
VEYSHNNEKKRYFLFNLPRELILPDSPVIAGIRISGLNKDDEVAGLETALATGTDIERLMNEISENGFVMPVFTSHGGSDDVRRNGLCVTEGWRKQFPEAIEVARAMDRSGTPYYVLPILKGNGVKFFNPIGAFGTKELCHLSSLLETETMQDGSEIYTFRRFSSRRFEETDMADTWAYNKRTSSVQGLPANLEDVLQRLHWLQPGYGTIIYTHLGHKVGNQISARLGWHEELFAAFGRLAEFVQQRDKDNPVPFRVWFAPASSVLAFAAVMKGLPSVIERDGHVVRITSWFDRNLGHRIPDPAVFGTSWLHGVTIHVPDPGKTEVFVDGIQMDNFTKNPADALGGPSITLVDKSGQIPFVPDVPSSMIHVGDSNVSRLSVEIPDQKEAAILRTSHGEGDGQWMLPIHPLKLRNVTHWGFEVQLLDTSVEWRVGFQTQEGVWFEAGSEPGLRWRVSSPPTGTWHRYTLAFVDGYGLNENSRESASIFSSLIRSKIVAVRISINGSKGGHDFALRDLSVFRPRPCTKIRPNKRILSGMVKMCLSGLPLVGEEIVCHTPEGISIVETDESGVYVFRNLPDNVRVRVELKDKNKMANYIRGNTAHMTSDQWDWDVEVVKN